MDDAPNNKIDPRERLNSFLIVSSILLKSRIKSLLKENILGCILRRKWALEGNNESVLLNTFKKYTNEMENVNMFYGRNDFMMQNKTLSLSGQNILYQIETQTQFQKWKVE